MALLRTARPGKPLEPPRVMARPWSGRSQRLSKGDVSLCFKGSIAEDCGRGAVLLRGSATQELGVFSALPTFPYWGTMSPLLCLLQGPSCDSQREQTPAGPCTNVLINDW